MESSQLVFFVREAVTWISVGAMVFGVVPPFVPQYLTIRKSRDTEGFSTYVCLVLLLANILRVFFWFCVHYELPLLVQSLLMIVTMLAMVHLCVRVRQEKEIDPPHRIWEMKYQFFWQWTELTDYLIFLIILCLAIGTVTILFIRVKLYVELLGFASLLTEASLGVPQLWRNLKQRSTKGMSAIMVVMWLCGDIFKTVYFVIRQAPIQFSVCGIIQILVDVAILLQVALYTGSSSSSSLID